MSRLYRFKKLIVMFAIALALQSTKPVMAAQALDGVWVQQQSGPDFSEYITATSTDALYVFGNSGLSKYSIPDNEWIQLSTSPLNKFSLNIIDTISFDYQSIFYNNKFYFYAATQVWEYDIISDTWNQKSSGSTNRQFYSMVLYNGKIYIYGGENIDDPQQGGDGRTLKDLWAYDIDSDTWTQKTDTSYSLRLHSATVFNDKMYVLGGIIDTTAVDGEPIVSNELWEYDFADDNWAIVNSAPFVKILSTLVVYDEDLYMFGGADFDDEYNLVESNQIWMYDFSSKNWSQETVTTGTPPSARFGATAIVHQTDMVLYGGMTTENNEDIIYYSDLWTYQFDRYNIVNGDGATIPGDSDNCFINNLFK